MADPRIFEGGGGADEKNQAQRGCEWGKNANFFKKVARNNEKIKSKGGCGRPTVPPGSATVSRLIHPQLFQIIVDARYYRRNKRKRNNVIYNFYYRHPCLEE